MKRADDYIIESRGECASELINKFINIHSIELSIEEFSFLESEVQFNDQVMISIYRINANH